MVKYFVSIDNGGNHLELVVDLETNLLNLYESSYHLSDENKDFLERMELTFDNYQVSLPTDKMYRIPLSEARLQGKGGYRRYKRQTHLLLPIPKLR